MLKIAGYINIVIAIGHIIGLFWADKMFEATGIKNEMAELSKQHHSFPYLVTIFVAIVFLIFGLYALSADNKFRKLPFLKPIIFIIACIYILRGLGELFVDFLTKTNTLSEIIFSLVALIIGLLFLIGGLCRWRKNTVKSLD